MDQDPRYFYIGSALILLLIGLVIFLLWAVHGRKTNNQELYSIYFKEHSLAGLQKDAPVTMRGIRIGSIKQIKFQQEDIERVLVTVTLDADTPVKKDTRAVVKTNFVTGLSSVDLVGTTQAATPLTTSARSGVLPVIPEGRTQLEELQSTLPEILQDTQQIFSQLAKIVRDENVDKISQILTNAETVTNELAQRSEAIGAALASIAATSSSVAGVTADVENIAKALSDNLGRISQEIEGLVSSTQTKIEQAGDSITTVTRSLKHGKESLIGPTEKNLLDQDL